MKFVLALLALVLLDAASIARADAADRIGVRNMTVPSAERGTELGVTLWYPAAPGGTQTLVGDNAVFQGVSAYQDAPISSGSFPVILLSHGGLRAAPNLDGWIAAHLANHGFVVAVPQRPNPGSQKASDATAEIWLRPADLSATLTALQREPGIDAQRVGVLGFLLGGSSALALSGAQRDAQAYARSCDDGGPGLDCAWFANNGVDLHKIDVANVARSSLDRRVGVIVAVDPELTATFTTASLSRISIPVHIINLGRTDTMLSGLNAASLPERIPHARYDVIPDATPFDSFNACKPEGKAILLSDGDDEGPCDDGARPRAEIHAQLAAMITDTFMRALQGGM
jgi:predicted dienelactone hydrolase